MPFAISPVTAEISAPIGIDDAGGDRLGVNTDGSINVDTNLDIVDFLDTPFLLASSTNIAASSSAPDTVVASLAAAVKKVQFIDTTGEFIGLYSDPAGTPVLEAIFGPGSDTFIDLKLPASTVIGIRNMQDAAITVGSVVVNFFG